MPDVPPPAGGRQPWEQLPNETDKQYAAFRIYRDMGRQRSILGASYRIRGLPVPPSANSPGTWKMWAKKNRWVERSRQFDEFHEGMADRARDNALFTAASMQGIAMVGDEIDWIARRKQTRAAEWDLSQRLQKKAHEMLDMALIRRKVIPADPQKNQPEIQIFEPAKWSFKTVTELVQTASQLARLSSELPQTIHKDDEAKSGEDDEAMFADSAGILEQALAPGQVPAMPEDVTTRPNINITRESALQGITTPMRIRPQPRTGGGGGAA
jgi:hypothetical protein